MTKRPQGVLTATPLLVPPFSFRVVPLYLATDATATSKGVQGGLQLPQEYAAPKVSAHAAAVRVWPEEVRGEDGVLVELREEQEVQIGYVQNAENILQGPQWVRRRFDQDSRATRLSLTLFPFSFAVNTPRATSTTSSPRPLTSTSASLSSKGQPWDHI